MRSRISLPLTASFCQAIGGVARRPAALLWPKQAPIHLRTTVTDRPSCRPFSHSPRRRTGPLPPDYLSEGELKIFNKIKEELQPSSLEVQDISGGCGSMYALDIASSKFAGLSVIKQHRLVNQVLGEDIKQWHGVQLKTRVE